MGEQIEVADADREAAEKYHFGDKPELLCEHFARHRQAAARAELERCVEVIREAEVKRFAKCIIEDPATVGVYFAAKELIDQLTKGPTR